MSETPLLSIFITNYNTVHFLEVLVEAISKLTKNSYEIIINDNGSNSTQLLRLTRLARTNPYINIHFRNSPEKHGGQAHGRALNALMPLARGTYGVVFDSDAVVLKKNWDEYLISQLHGNIKIAGTPLGEAWAGGKATDFPYQFILLFDLAVFRSLNISWEPIIDAAGKAVIKNKIVQDTAWELREKFRQAGYGGALLFPQNTRFWQKGPFKQLLGVEEYYTDQNCTTLFASHFGRGHTGGMAKYKQAMYMLPVIGRILARQQGQQDIHTWITTCRRIINEQAAL